MLTDNTFFYIYNKELTEILTISLKHLDVILHKRYSVKKQCKRTRLVEDILNKHKKTNIKKYFDRKITQKIHKVRSRKFTSTITGLVLALGKSPAKIIAVSFSLPFHASEKTISPFGHI